VKHETIPKSKKNSWAAEGDLMDFDVEDLATEIMNIMEQGIVVWSEDGMCELHNTRIYEMLEVDGAVLSIGTLRADYLRFAVNRAEFSQEQAEWAEAEYATGRVFKFDRKLPTGRVVSTSARPARGGGHVVTYSDVTESHQAAEELSKAKQIAEDAERRAREVLESERARQEEANLIGHLDEWLQSCKSLDELFMIVGRFMGKLLPHSQGELYIYSNSRDVLDGMCHWACGEIQEHIAPDSCWALRRGRAYEFEKGGLCFPCDHVETEDGSNNADEYICVPIVAHGDTVGLLHIRFNTEEKRAARISNTAAFAVRCGEHISMAIANVKLRDELHDQSIRDPLTSLYNRRYFMDAMRREITQAERKGLSFGLISFDADKFKSFNDNHGHDAGDMVLRAIGEQLRATLSPGQVGCRIGGEEFAILAPGVTLDEAIELAERLREAISETQVQYVDGVLPRVTISCGVSAYPSCGTSPAALLKRADEALYRAKDGGRNCVHSTKSAKPAGK